MKKKVIGDRVTRKYRFITLLGITVLFSLISLNTAAAVQDSMVWNNNSNIKYNSDNNNTNYNSGNTNIIKDSYNKNNSDNTNNIKDSYNKNNSYNTNYIKDSYNKSDNYLNNNQPGLKPRQNSMSDTSTELTSSANEYTSGQQITFTAKIDTTSQGTEKPSGTVTFIDGNTQIGTETVNSGQAILTTSSLSVGSHSITAQYSGNNNFKPSASSVFTLTVKEESIFKHPLFPVACGIVATVISGIILRKYDWWERLRGKGT